MEGAKMAFEIFFIIWLTCGVFTLGVMSPIVAKMKRDKAEEWGLTDIFPIVSMFVAWPYWLGIIIGSVFLAHTTLCEHFVPELKKENSTSDEVTTT